MEFTAAYANERVIGYLFLPRSADPPYQPVVFFPTLAAFFSRDSDNISEFSMLDFIPRSGRALFYPIIKGTYERSYEELRPGMVAQRERVVRQVQDVFRVVDYIESRQDLRSDAIGYMGVSYGGELGIPVALEKRFSALSLVGAAYDAQWRGSVLPEAAPWNFVPRITTPTVVINGRNDFQHPYETGQVPFFEAIDVPEADKSLVILDAGHFPPWNEVIRHTLDWFDRYLGPVR